VRTLCSKWSEGKCDGSIFQRITRKVWSTAWEDHVIFSSGYLVHPFRFLTGLAPTNISSDFPSVSSYTTHFDNTLFNIFSTKVIVSRLFLIFYKNLHMPISNVLWPITIHVITPVFINQMSKV